jgi:hypothetical protein
MAQNSSWDIDPIITTSNVKSNQRKKKEIECFWLSFYSLPLSLSLLLCMCSSIRSWFFMRLLFTLQNKCLYKPQLVLLPYLHMNRVRPIENRWTTRREKERKPEVASELIIIVYKHQRHFSFFLLLLFSTTKQIIYVDTISRFLFLSMSVWLGVNG